MSGLNKAERFDKIIFIASLFVFAVTFIIYKYRLVPDSGGYIDMAVTGREPLYPFFLFIFRSVFKFLNLNLDYLYAVSIAQNLLAAYAVYFASVNLKRLFNLNKFLACLIFIIFLAPFFLSVIFSITGTVISCSIWTEGLTIPLYYIYLTLLIKYILNHELRDYLYAVALSVMLALTRGQMLVLFIINFCAAIFACKKFIKPLLIMLASFIIAALISRCYYYVTAGYFIGNTYGPITTSSGVFLAAGESEADLFNDDKDLRELYIKINNRIDEQGFRANLYKNNILNDGLNAEAAHDPVKFYITGPLIHEYVADNYNLKGIEAEIARDKLASQMMRRLLTSSNVIKNYIKIYLGYLSNGFIRSAAFIHPVLNIYAAFIYAIAFILLAVCFIKNLKREALLMLFALLALTGFVTSISLVIMPLSRYVIYNLPFLYSAMLICFVKIILNLNKKELQ